MAKPRNYTKATEYEEKPEQVEHREERNRARAMETKKLGAAAVKGKDIGHKVPEARGGHTAPGNIEVQSVASNRGWRKGRRGYSVPTVDK